VGVGWWWASLPLVLGCGGPSPHLHVLIDLLGLVMWPSSSVLWRLWAVAAIDVGHRCCGCGVVVGFVAIGVGWWWVFTTPSRAHRSAGAGDMAQRQCIVEVVGGGSYGRRPSSLWVWGGDEPSLPLVLGQQ